VTWTAPTGPDALKARYLTPFAPVLASSVGEEVGVDTPVIDGLIAIRSAMLSRDFRAEGRTLVRLGLAGLGVEGLRRFAVTSDFAPAAPGTSRSPG
jgi:opine dehydrogenase